MTPRIAELLIIAMDNVIREAIEEEREAAAKLVDESCRASLPPSEPAACLRDKNRGMRNTTKTVYALKVTQKTDVGIGDVLIRLFDSKENAEKAKLEREKRRGRFDVGSPWIEARQE